MDLKQFLSRQRNSFWLSCWCVSGFANDMLAEAVMMIELYTYTTFYILSRKCSIRNFNICQLPQLRASQSPYVNQSMM